MRSSKVAPWLSSVENAMTGAYWRTVPCVTFDDLIYVGSQLDSGQTGSGTTADKTWAFSSDQTSHTFETFTANVYDGQQAHEIEYCFATGASITMGDATGLTQFSMDMVGRQVTKVTLDSVAANNAVKIDNAGWTIKYATAQSGLDGASARTILVDRA